MSCGFVGSVVSFVSSAVDFIVSLMGFVIPAEVFVTSAGGFVSSDGIVVVSAGRLENSVNCLFFLAEARLAEEKAKQSADEFFRITLASL